MMPIKPFELLPLARQLCLNLIMRLNSWILRNYAFLRMETSFTVAIITSLINIPIKDIRMNAEVMLHMPILLKLILQHT